MYKLLTTTALVLTVAASSSFADEWVGGKKLTQDLNGIYTGLDGVGGNAASAGTDAFNTLQNQTDGKLHEFLTEANKGVTYITIASDVDSGILSLGVNEGTSLTNIIGAQEALVSAVQVDLFGADEQGAVYVPGSPDVADGTSGYVNHTQGGLVGTAINGLVTDVNTLNDGLIDGSIVHDEVIDDTAGAGNWTIKSGNATVDGIQATLSGINNVTTTANDAGGNYFGNLNNFAVDGSNASSYRIGPITVDADATSGIRYTNYTNWANNVITVDDTTYTYIGTGSLGLNGGSTSVTVDGVEVNPATDVNFTAN